MKVKVKVKVGVRVRVKVKVKVEVKVKMRMKVRCYNKFNRWMSRGYIKPMKKTNIFVYLHPRVVWQPLLPRLQSTRLPDVSCNATLAMASQKRSG